MKKGNVMMQSNLIMFIVSLITLFGSKNLNAVLDGRVTPIILTTTYTFTNYEWVKGRVTFMNGFDLPVNGTVIFDSSGKVYGKIKFTKSTLVLNNTLYWEKNALLSGAGFLDLRGNTLNLSRVTMFDPGSSFFIISDGEIRGRKNNQFIIGLTPIYFIDNVQSFTLSNIVIREPYNMRTALNAPRRFCLNNMTLIFWNTLTIESHRVSINNFVDIQPYAGLRRLTITQGLELSPTAELNIRPKSILSVREIYAPDIFSTIILDSAQLILRSTDTSMFIFKNPDHPLSPGRGRLLVKGQSELKSLSAGLKLLVPSQSSLIFDNSAQLKLGLPAGMSIF